MRQPIRFQGLFEATNQIVGRWKTKSIMWQILQLLFPKLSFFPSQKWMNLISYSFWMMKWDPSGCSTTFKGLSHFSCTFWWVFMTIFFLLKLKNPRDPKTTVSTDSARDEENQELPQELDVSRFTIISSDEIHELCEVALGYTRNWFLWLEHSHQWTTSQRTQKCYSTVKTAGSSVSPILIGMESGVLLDNDTEPL